MSECAFSIVTREIPYSGKCFLVCERYDAARFPADLNAVIAEAQGLGARSFYFTCRDKAFAQGGDFSAAGFAFLFYSDFYILEKILSVEEGPVYRLKRMNETNAPLFAALYNEAFIDVPNAVTIDDLEIQRILDGPYEAGFLMLGAEPQGVFELDFSGEAAEIAAVAIRPELQGAGGGHRAMRTLEQDLLKRGHTKIQLLVASANERAAGLYKARGYCRARRVSRWFCLSPEGSVSYPPDSWR